MNISHRGLGEVVTTIETSDNTIEKGSILSVADNKAVAAAEGKPFVGTAASSPSLGKVAVQVSGYAETGYDGTPVYGTNTVSVKDAQTLSIAGETRDVSTAYAEISVITIDTVNKIIGFMM